VYKQKLANAITESVGLKLSEHMQKQALSLGGVAKGLGAAGIGGGLGYLTFNPKARQGILDYFTPPDDVMEEGGGTPALFQMSRNTREPSTLDKIKSFISEHKVPLGIGAGLGAAGLGAGAWYLSDKDRRKKLMDKIDPYYRKAYPYLNAGKEALKGMYEEGPLDYIRNTRDRTKALEGIKSVLGF